MIEFVPTGKRLVLKSINLFCLVILLFCHYLNAQELKIKWTGIAGVLIDDGKKVIAIDITFTKPTLQHWLFNLPFYPDEKLIQEKVATYSIQKIDALFVSHTHFDHAVDISYLSHYFKSILYGSQSLKNLSYNYAQILKKQIQFQDIEHQKDIHIGDFKITPYRRKHAAIVQSIDWHFLEGQIDKSTKLHFYDYLEGDSWNYLIKHPKGNIFFDQSGTPEIETLIKLPKIQTAIIGVANKISLENWVEGYVKVLKPQKILPIHHDWFLLNFPQKSFTMWRTDLPKIQQELHKHHVNLMQF